MTVEPDVSTATVVDRYLEVLSTEQRDRIEPVRVPVDRGPLPLNFVAEVLTDPRSLFDSLPAHDVDTRVRRLVVFALWLADQPADRLGDLGSRAARFRFLVWTLTPRLAGTALADPTPTSVAWPDNVGTRTGEEFVLAQARTARNDWLGYLDRWEDDPWLAARQASGGGAVEGDLHWLTATWPPHSDDDGKAPWPARPTWLDLGSPRASRADRYGDHRRVAADLAERHWLPAGSLPNAAAAFFPHSRPRRLAIYGYPAVATVVLVSFVAGYDQARWLALGLCALGLITVVLVPPLVDSLALLRIPAAAAVGEVVLLGLTPRWWLSPGGWLLGAGLLVAAAGYLVLEARLHGVPHPLALGRGFGIAAFGALHAAALSLVVFGFVAPQVAETGKCLDGWWAADPWSPRPLETVGQCAATVGANAGAAPAGVLLLMTGWSFAFGLAAQILWDDRPVSAPLGRMRRRRGAS